MKSIKIWKSILILLLGVCWFSTVSPVFGDISSPLGYKGVVSESTHYPPGSEYTFANVSSVHPFVTYPSGYGNEAVKVYEEDDLIVFIYVAPSSGSTETYYLNKKSKRFTLIEVGALEAMAEGKEFIPKVTRGILK